MRFVFAVPAFVNTTPVNSVTALANALSEDFRVDVCALRGSGKHYGNLRPNIPIHTLVDQSLGAFVEKMGQQPILVSCCFSADLNNVLSKGSALKVISMGENLFGRYRRTYGWMGMALGVLHMGLCRFSDATLVVNKPVARQVERLSGKSSYLLPVFVDEQALETRRVFADRVERKRLVYFGPLTRQCVLNKLLRVVSVFEDMQLDVVGDGRERRKLEAFAQETGIRDRVTFHRMKADPVELARDAAGLVAGEGITAESRVVHEALYLGSPCLLPEQEACSELIVSGDNGFVFENEDELLEAVIRLQSVNDIKLSRGGVRAILLPDAFRQGGVVENFLTYVQDRIAA